ncbi:hypothetical protein [Bradyrhizobium sp. LB11.1]|uniref:hypothetical protein n=1 Tax=Bradyrhizobium sp. LB11.1 TaxID=3156326 RepID=UPI003393C8CF
MTISIPIEAPVEHRARCRLGIEERDMTLTWRQRKLLTEYLEPKAHVKEAGGMTMYNLITAGWIVKVSTFEDTVYPVYQTTELGQQQLADEKG